MRLLPPSPPGIGFIGGEPTIYGQRLLELLLLCRNRLPDAKVHEAGAIGERALGTLAWFSSQVRVMR